MDCIITTHVEDIHTTVGMVDMVDNITHTTIAEEDPVNHVIDVHRGTRGHPIKRFPAHNVGFLESSQW